MFSRITDLLRPSGAIKDETQRKNDGNRKNLRKRDEESEIAAGDDVVLFSIDAIRAMIAKDKAGGEDAFRVLGFLEQNGIKNLPVRDGQPVMDAVLQAHKMLKGE